LTWVCHSKSLSLEIYIQNCEGTLKMSYHRRLSMMTSSRHKPELACLVKSTTLRHWTGRPTPADNLPILATVCRSASRAIETEWLCIDVTENIDIKSLTSENLRTRNSHPKRDRHLWTQQTSKRHTRNFARACYLRLNNLSHVAVTRTTCYAGISARCLTVTS